MIHLFRPDVGWREAWAAARAMRSRWLGPGPRVDAFEAALRAHLGVDVLTLSCATDGLFLALDLLGVGRGDEVIVPDIHFIGAASAVLARGARVVPCDVDPYTLNARVQDVQAVLTPRTRAIMALDYGGLLCDRRIFGLGVPVVEDAALALGMDGAGIRGDVGVWSFDAMKTITTGGSGGAIWVKGGLGRARRLARLGLDRQHGLDAKAGRWWEYSLMEPGRLSEMNDVQAAVGLVQLKRLDRMLETRRRLCLAYDDELANYVRCPPYRKAPSFYWIQTARRDALADHLKSKGIYTSFKYWPIHKALGLAGHYPAANWAASQTLLLPLHPCMTEGQAAMIGREVRRFLGGKR